MIQQANKDCLHLLKTGAALILRCQVHEADVAEEAVVLCQTVVVCQEAGMEVVVCRKVIRMPDLAANSSSSIWISMVDQFDPIYKSWVSNSVARYQSRPQEIKERKWGQVEGLMVMVFLLPN